MSRTIPIQPHVDVEVFGDKELIATMESWAARAGNAMPAYEAMHQYLMEVEQELFESEGLTGQHGAWEGRQETPRNENNPNPILQASGELMRSLSDASSPHHRFAMTPAGFVMGSDLDYGEFHQTGAGELPQRRVVDLTVPQKMVLLQILAEYITAAGLTPVGSLGWRARGRRGRFVG